MADRKSFGESALQRARKFVYRLDKKAVLHPDDQNVRTSFGHEQIHYTPSRLGQQSIKALHVQRPPPPCAAPKRRDQPPSLSLEQRLLILERRLTILEHKVQSDNVVQIT